MPKSITFRQATFGVLLLALGQFIIQMRLLTKGMEYAAASLVIDDTYYYLQTAWNTRALGFVTFDGLHSTNGVQLLWFAIVFLLAMVAKSKAFLLFSALAVSFLFNGLCYLVILKIAAILKQPVLALFMASFWALQTLPFKIYSTGMENSLHALVFWCVIWQGTVFLIRVHKKERPNFWGLAVGLILVVWTRLDSAVISAVVFFFCVGMLAYSDRNNLGLSLGMNGKALAGSSLLAGAALLVQLASFRFMGGSFLPVSALVKTNAVSGGSAIGPVDKLVGLFTLGMPSILQGRFPTLVLVLLGLSGVLLVILIMGVRRDHSDEMRAFLSLWSCLLFGELIYYAFVALSEVEYTPYFVWYRSPSFIFWIITGSLLALFALEYLSRALPMVRSSKWVPVGMSLAVLSVAAYLFARGTGSISELYAARYDAALWIEANSPPDTVFAAWNAGELGFFSNREFINLDGLINNVEYYQRVLHGSMPLKDYLAENRVDYIVDYQIYDSLPDFPVVRSFPISDGSGRSIQVWKVTSQVSSTE
jgi:hypothetical protein